MLTPWFPKHTTALAPLETWSEPGPLAEMDHDQQERRWQAYHGVLLPFPPDLDGDGPDLRAHYGWLLCGFAGAILAASLFCAFPQPWAMFAAGAVFAGAVVLFAKAHVAAGNAEDLYAQAAATDEGGDH